MLTKQQFQSGEVLELVPSITFRQLGYWAMTGLVEPSMQKAAGKGSRRIYNWLDLVVLQTVADLLDAGASVQRIGKAVHQLRRYSKTHALAQHLLMVSADGEIYEVLERNKVGQRLSKHPGQTFWLSPVGDFAEEIQKRMAQKQPSKSTSVVV